MKRITTYIYALECILLLSVAYSCAEGTDAEQRSDGENRMVFAMTRSNQDIVNHTTVYQFDTSWQYMKKIQGVTYGTDDLSMRMDAGTWNLALVTGGNLNPASVISPVSGEGRAGKMWQTQAVGGVLPSMPEVRTAYIEDQVIIPNTTNYASTSMHRNVAMVRVYIEKTRGLDPTGTHTLYINNVPTTLNWAGELYPNKHTPDVSTSPLKGTFSIHDKVGDAGFQESSVLEFIIPAHKGNDYLSPSPQDTTTHKLNLGVDLACAGGTRFTKNGVEISHAPRANSILEVRLSMVGELEVSANILDWNEVEVKAALDYTELMVSKAKVELAYKDTIYVNTNAADFTVTPAGGVSWMNAVRIGTTNAVEITTEVSSYNSPRSSYFSVTANNLVKSIPVTQRPEKGTISVDNKRLVFCPVTHAQRTVQINSIKGSWEILAPSTKAASNVQTGNAGSTNVTFTRASTTDFNLFDSYYGDDYVIVKNTTTLDTDTIQLVNCYIDVPYSTINANAPTGTNQTAETVSEGITVYGGNKGLFIDQWSTWIHNSPVWNASDQKLTFTTDRAADDEPRDGFMTFHHAECSDYAMTITVHQDIIVTIPEFDYFVIKYTWNVGDIDIKVQFENNGMSYDGKPYDGTSNPNNKYVGFSVSTQSYNGQTLLQWGGDARAGQGETVFFNTPIIDSDAASPRFVKLACYAYWYDDNNKTPGEPVRTTIFAYRGGTMKQVGTNFVNEGGMQVYTHSKQQKLSIIGNSSILNPEKLVEVNYDRVKHSAIVTFTGIELNTPLISTPSNSPVRPSNLLDEEYETQKQQDIKDLEYKK